MVAFRAQRVSGVQNNAQNITRIHDFIQFRPYSLGLTRRDSFILIIDLFLYEFHFLGVHVGILFLIILLSLRFGSLSEIFDGVGYYFGFKSTLFRTEGVLELLYIR